jgi:hypothetical protein
MSSLLSWWSATGGVGAAPQAGNDLQSPPSNNLGSVLGGPFNAVSQQNVAGQQWLTPLSQFEENVPDDELEFYGKLSRWPRAMLASSPNVPRYHSIACCQRCVML